MTPPTPQTLALFDLDHTLLDGDGDDLWCRFLVQHGLADTALSFRNDQLGRDYRDGRVGVHEFSAFYAALLGGQTPDFWAPWQDRFLSDVIRPRLPDPARAIVSRHRGLGHTVVLTTASNRVIAERTARELGVEHLIATELELHHGRYTGQIEGTPNMREGKVTRLRAWLDERHWPQQLIAGAWFYSDSINDLPLLEAVATPVAANADAALTLHARGRGWPCIRLIPQPAAA
jgi:HAD superfamily hydrolase (TIGR01490 family)